MTIEEEEKIFERDWEADLPKLIVHRKKVGIFRTVREFFWKTRYPVLALYRWARTREASFDAMSYPHIVNSDNMTPIQDLPTRIELNEGWSIPESDLKYLVYGPLTRGSEILVPAVPEQAVVFTLWEAVKVFSTIGGAIAFLLLLVGKC